MNTNPHRSYEQARQAAAAAFEATGEPARGVIESVRAAAAPVEAMSRHLGQLAAAIEAARDEHRDAHDELRRIRDLPRRVQRSMERLVVRCTGSRPVVTVYAVGGRLLLHLSGKLVISDPTLDPADVPTWLTHPEKAFRPHPARWLPQHGDVWRTDCACGTAHDVSADAVFAAVPGDRRRRTVGVATIAPSDMR